MTFRPNFHVLHLVVLLAGLLAPLLPSPALGEEKDGLIKIVTVGLLDHDTPGLWSGFQRESGVDINAEVTFRSFYERSAEESETPKLDLWIYPSVGVSINDSGDTSKVYADLRFELRPNIEPQIFFAVGLGAALHDGKLDTRRRDRKSLGSRVLFHIPAELGVEIAEHHRVSLFYDHVSNNYLADKNEGMDTIGLRYGFKF